MSPKKSKKPKKTAIKKTTERLYELMVEEKLSELAWEEKDGIKLKLKRKSSYIRAGGAVPVKKQDTEKEEKKEDKSQYIHSPMNGIFYSSSQPGEPPFVKKGDKIEKDATVCILEAMKLMNEVRVEKPCCIKEVMVKNSEAVKTNQPLFKISDI